MRNRERGTGNQKWAGHWQLWAQCRAWTQKSWDHDLSRSQLLNPLSHTGPKNSLIFFKYEIYCQIGFHTTPSARPNRCPPQYPSPTLRPSYPSSILSLFSVFKSLLYVGSIFNNVIEVPVGLVVVNDLLPTFSCAMVFAQCLPYGTASPRGENKPVAFTVTP